MKSQGTPAERFVAVPDLYFLTIIFQRPGKQNPLFNCFPDKKICLLLVRTVLGLRQLMDLYICSQVSHFT